MLHDGFIKKEVNQVHMKDAAFVKRPMQDVVTDDHLAEGISGEGEGAAFAFKLFFRADGVGGLHVDSLPSLVDDEVDIVWDFHGLSMGIPAGSDDDADIDGESAPDEFVVDRVFHEMRDFRLTKGEPRIAKTEVLAIELVGEGEVGASLDVVAARLGKEKCVLHMRDVGSNCMHGRFHPLRRKRMGDVRRIGEGADGRSEEIHNFAKQFRTGDSAALDDVLEVHHIIPSYPLIASDVIRAGKSLGLFTAAKSSHIFWRIFIAIVSCFLIPFQGF